MRILIVILIFWNFPCFGQFGLAGELANSKDTGGIFQLVRRVDPCLDANWRLDSVRSQLIPHNRQGYLFYFHKNADGDKLQRWYCFSYYSEFSGAWEKRYYSNGSLTEGNIYLDEKGIFLITQFFRIQDSTGTLSNKWRVVHEQYANCKLKDRITFTGDYWQMSKHFKSRTEFEEWKKKNSATEMEVTNCP
jgi:hypothetical protein